MKGVVIDTMLFSRRKTDAVTKKAEEKRLEEIKRQLDREVEALQSSFYERFFQLIGAKKAGAAIELRDGTVVISEGGKLTKTAVQGHRAGRPQDPPAVHERRRRRTARPGSCSPTTSAATRR